MGLEVMTMITREGKAHALIHESDCKHTGEYTIFAQARLLRYYHDVYIATKDPKARERGLALKNWTVRLFNVLKPQLTYVDADGELLS